MFLCIIYFVSIYFLYFIRYSCIITIIIIIVIIIIIIMLIVSKLVEVSKHNFRELCVERFSVHILTLDHIY